MARQTAVVVRPPEEDLYGLYTLCGGDERLIIEHLAKVFERAPEDIAQTVRSWLADLPAVPPPSRQRSAPPMIAPSTRLASSSRAYPLPKNVPPLSAPTTSHDLVAAMRALDNRLNRSTRTGDVAAQPASSSLQVGEPFHAPLQSAVAAGARLGLEPVPEGAGLEEGAFLRI